MMLQKVRSRYQTMLIRRETIVAVRYHKRSLDLCVHFLNVFVRYPDAGPNKGPKHVAVFY